MCDPQPRGDTAIKDQAYTNAVEAVKVKAEQRRIKLEMIAYKIVVLLREGDFTCQEKHRIELIVKGYLDG